MKIYEKTIEKVILISGMLATISVALITIFIFKTGLPAIGEIGWFDFVTGTSWRPTNESFGILPLIIGTLWVTFGALLLGVPVGISCAIFLAEIAPKRIGNMFKTAIEVLAGIPSVVYGFFGLIVIVPAIREYILPAVQIVNKSASTSGFSILAGSIILAIMILPTIVSLSKNAIESVPMEYKEASLALGANKAETITKVILPSAKSGIFSSIILGMGRAIGETMAVLLITGNVATVPKGILDPVATLTGTIAMEMSYAGPFHQQSLFAIGIILFVIIMMLNIGAQIIMKSIGGNSQ